MKKLVGFGALFLFVLSLNHGWCSDKLDFPNAPITMIVPFAAGGSTDIGARILSAEAEKFLGKPIAILNTPGGGGWIGWGNLLKAPKDGYTIGHINDVAVIAGYLDPKQKRNNSIKDFAPIVCHVMDYNTIAINPTETRFKTLTELVEYAKTKEVTISSTAPTGDEYQVMLIINAKLGTKFIPVHLNGAAGCLTAVMGKHVDVYFGNVGDTTVPVKNGQLKAIAVLAEKRSLFLPDVPTFKEATGNHIVGYSARGIAAPVGVDQAIMKIL